VSRNLDPEKQAALIKAYEAPLNQLEDDAAVLFADAVHPTLAVRPGGCWAPKDRASGSPPARSALRDAHISCAWRPACAAARVNQIYGDR